ncbi:MAG: hypothetical protein NT118_12800 [Lentisphaerae bacterium]|nr:hypothetical protein [Lentisphaerota bacterium]
MPKVGRVLGATELAEVRNAPLRADSGENSVLASLCEEPSLP